VEDCIQRICRAYGAIDVDVFTITSSIVVSAEGKDGSRATQTRRITGSHTDLTRLHRLNDLSRRICSGNIGLDAAKAEYKGIVSAKGYPLWLESLAYGMIAGAFALFFGGGAADGVFGFLIGALLRAVTLLTEKAELGRIFDRFSCSFLVSLLSYILLFMGMIPTVDYVIIGNIMLLIPGIGLTNALRDLFVGDSITGLFRLIEALLMALAIAAGHFLVTLGVGAL
jgi:uncharacterized membrane protein YjjP (DUF1212 family)